MGNTDHYLVRAKVRIRISTHKYNKTRTIPQWNMDELLNEAKQQQDIEKLEQTLNSETEYNEIENCRNNNEDHRKCIWKK